MISIDIDNETASERADELKAILYTPCCHVALIPGFYRYIFSLECEAFTQAIAKLNDLKIKFNKVTW
jgi:hypothetical protein